MTRHVDFRPFRDADRRAGAADLSELADATTDFWNGSMGVFEVEAG